MIRELCEKHTSLSDEDIDKIENIANMLPNIAELIKADVFIDCLTNNPDIAVVVAEAKPSEYQSLYRHTVVGELALYQNEPAVLRTLKIGLPARDFKAVTQEKITVRQDVVPIKNDSGKVIGVIVAEKDITENINQDKKIEMLTETTEQLTGTILSLTSKDGMIANYLNDAVVMFDGCGVVRYRNPVAEELFRKLGSKDDIIGSSFDSLSLDGRTFSSVVSCEKLCAVDVTAGKFSLHIKYIVPGTKEDIIKLIAIIKDVTEVREKEKELILKSVAMRELHHRVKNNLQTVASLLRLQSRRIENDISKAVLNESINRIMSISATHEILAKSGVDDVDIKTVLSRIVDSVKRLLSLPNRNIEVEISGDNIRINSDRAASIALVINELLQNSYEHAFEGKESGNIEIYVQKGQVYSSISVIDNGRGFDIAMVPPESLGLNIVKSIVRDKINGSIIFDSSPAGTKVKFDFKNE